MALRDIGATVLSVFGILGAILGAKVIAFEPGTDLCLHSPVKNVRFHVESADSFGGVHQLTVQSHADDVFNRGYYLETGQTLYVKFSRHDQLRGVYTSEAISGPEGSKVHMIWNVL